MEIADPDLGGSVDLILGNLDMEQCLHEGRVLIDGFKLLSTPFGWSVAGPLYGFPPVNINQTAAEQDSLDDELRRLWELDQVPTAPPPTKILLFLSSSPLTPEWTADSW